MCEDDFNCTHQNNCAFFCHKSLKNSCQALTYALKIVNQSVTLKTFESSFSGTDAFEPIANQSPDGDIFEDLLEKLYCSPLIMLIDNIQEIPEPCLKLSVNNCWNMLNSPASKVAKYAAIVILLACQKYKDTIPLFLESKLKNDRIENINAFRVLWSTRNSIWHLVDRRVARLYKLSRLGIFNRTFINPCDFFVKNSA
jgi:hypothetical protein